MINVCILTKASYGYVIQFCLIIGRPSHILVPECVGRFSTVN